MSGGTGGRRPGGGEQAGQDAGHRAVEQGFLRGGAAVAGLAGERGRQVRVLAVGRDPKQVPGQGFLPLGGVLPGPLLGELRLREQPHGTGEQADRLELGLRGHGCPGQRGQGVLDEGDRVRPRKAAGGRDTVTLIHKGTVSQGVVDNANLYFQDTSSSTAAVFYQVGLTAATPMELYSGSVIPSLSSYTLIGTDTVHLAFMESVVAPTSQATISTIPIGVLSTTPTAIAGPYNGNVFEPFLAAPKANDWAANKLFFTILQFTAGPPVKYTYSSTATALSAIAPTPKKNSAYESLGTGSVWQAKGITDTDGGLGGASMNLVNVTTLADSALTTTGGLAYHIPAHYNGILVELSSAKIGFGALGSTVSTQPEVGLACDVAGKFIIEVTDTNTNVVY